MRRVTFVLDLFQSEADRRRSEKVLLVLLAALVACNESYLKAHPEVPDLYRAGVRYVPEPPGEEDWKTIPIVLEDREGDCEDLGAYRIAELRVRYRTKARPRITWRWRWIAGRRVSVYHITLVHPDGRIEDPSRLLGMGD